LLESFEGISSAWARVNYGQDELELSLKPRAAELGLTQAMLAQQIRQAFYGEEAQRVLVHAQTVMPAKPDLGQPDLTEAITWGETHVVEDSERKRNGSVPDYAQISVEFSGGIIGFIALSHASYIRKGFAPALELHGTAGSLSVDRLTGNLYFADSPEPARLLERVEDETSRNRFEQFIFPALRAGTVGIGTEHPGLDDGWRVQIFTDAAVASAQQGTWADLAEFDAEA